MRAMAQFDEAIDLYDEVDDPAYGLAYGIQVKAAAMIFRSYCHYFVGNIDKAPGGHS